MLGFCPQFLRKSESEWEVEKPVSRNLNSVELNLIQMKDTLIKFENHSSYYRLQKLVGWVLRAKNNFLAVRRNHIARVVTPYLQFQEWKESEIFLCKQAQQDSFTEEIESLLQLKKIPKSSSIQKLCPILTESYEYMVG